MTETIPEGPTDPRLSARPDDNNTTVVTPGYGSPLHTGPSSSPTPYSRPPIIPGPPGPVGSPIVPVTEQLDYPSGRIYTSEQPAAPEPAPGIGADRGKTTIANDVVDRVIKKIVDLTVEEIAGVDSLAPPSGGEPVVVRQEEDDKVEIEIAIRVEFGHVVREVVDKTRASVVTQTERLLGVTVTDVNVTVADVTFEAPEG